MVSQCDWRFRYWYLLHYEILAPHGYQKDTTIYTVKVEDQAVQEIEVRDVPQTNLVDLVLVKQDAQTGNKAQGMAV